MSGRLAGLAALAFAVALLAACSSEGEAPTAAPTTTASSAPARVEPSSTAAARGEPATAAVAPAASRAPSTPTARPDGGGFEIRTVLRRDAIPSIDNPEFLDAEQASELMGDDHLIIGLSVGDEHRAYSTAFLSSHEIVNDTVGGEPVAVTW